MPRRMWLEHCAQSIIAARPWLGTITAIRIAADLWDETGGTMAPEQAASAELASWPAAYLIAIEGRHPEFRDSASAALNGAMQMLAAALEPLMAEVRDPSGRHLVTLRRDDDGSITEIPF